MAVDERAWIQLQKSVEQSLGAESAVTLMTLLPPTGWADVATTHDVSRAVQEVRTLEERMDARFTKVDARFDVLEGRFEAFDERLELTEQRLLAALRGELVAAVATQTRTVVFALCGTVVSMAGLALAFARVL